MKLTVDRQRVYHKRDRLKQLRAFGHAARLESVTRAGEYLEISQPAVSLHLRELEHELEALLFERRGPKISLTPAGERLYAIAMPLIASMDKISETFAEGFEESVDRTLRIAAGPSATAFVLPPYLRRFREEFPKVRLRVKNALVGDALKLLVAREADFAMGADEPVSGEFSFHPVFAYRHVLIVPEDHPLAGREAVDIEEATRYPAIVPPAETYVRQPDNSAARRFVADATVAMTTSGWSVIKHCVQAGLGIAVIPSMCLTARDRLSVVPLREERGEMTYGIFTRNGRGPLPYPAELFIRMMIPDFPERA